MWVRNNNPVLVDDVSFASPRLAAEYISRTRNISLSAAEDRIRVGRIDFVRHSCRRKQTVVDGKVFKSKKDAIAYIAATLGITASAALHRLYRGRLAMNVSDATPLS
jgi:hypothetical protein